MSIALRYLRTDPDALNQRQHIHEHWLDYFRTFYYDCGIDYVLCAKNASTTLSYFYFKHEYNKPPGGYWHEEKRDKLDAYVKRRDNWRKHVQLKTIDPHSRYLLRKKSHKICVKRDPVERALSAVFTINMVHNIYQNPKDVNLLYREVISLLNNFETEDNHHFYTQSRYMGVPNLYDRIYDMHEVPQMLDDIQKISGKSIDFDNRQRYNVSSAQITVDDLPNNIIQRIKTLYEEDYDNGWY